ncbi:hypothetical protein CH306_23465 [Rhodococcus sp. 15-725-2-2b]|uniref:hypothetical protein n=1 Tax=unclassified Rhodococcus (in: high G+C Gram-positive bacteria) TaxID=192944 RepID=UPI000B9A5B9E|nr:MULTISPECIES: hypothetical protein [unclassified Rhodococcus (in: high G+C Gram-positive bacteria)]OZC71823.1 hypothetical protein CH277_04900 [Rhodococcus sp. 06-469-3-2]OZD42612.1 hypothetical protein CH264_22315 [Rhodococcus sp. 06-1477-1A]OZE68318.1 hypothetical protein CH306_23465 [Rhodococcus sp. 15-725-2-2b]
MPTPTVPFALSRRGLFRLAGAAVLSATTVSTMVACGREEISGPALDTLTAQLRAARADAADATAAAAVIADYAAALGIVAAQRTEHADALDTEITRATGTSTDTSSVTATTTQAPTTPPDLAAVREMLTASARSAADAARNESGYRAGLLGSISASCTVSALVVLA